MRTPRRRARPLAGLSAEHMALVRCAVGIVLLTRPRAVVDVLGGAAALTPAGDWSTRMLAARELAVGLGAVAAAREGDVHARTWSAAGALCDAVDAVVLTAALRSGRLGRSTRTRGAASACALGAVVAVVVQVRDVRRHWV